MAVGLGVASLGVLIYFIHHVAQSIQAPHVVGTVGRELDEQIEKLFPGGVGRDRRVARPRRAGRPRPRRRSTREGQPVPARRVGYVQAIDTDRLMKLAAEHGRVMRVALRPGDFVIPRTALLHLWPPVTEAEADDYAAAHPRRDGQKNDGQKSDGQGSDGQGTTGTAAATARTAC